MLRYRLAAAMILIASYPAASLGDEETDALRTKVVTWLKANNVDGKEDSEIITKLTRPINEILDKRLNFTVFVGANLTKSQRPFMLCGWGGEFFAFELTADQARSLKLTPTNMSGGANQRVGIRSVLLPAQVSDLKIADAQNQDGGWPIVVSLKLTIPQPVIAAKTAWVRLELKFKDSVETQYIKPGELPKGEGTLQLAFQAINPADGKSKPRRGPVGAFVSLVERSPDGDASKLRVLSNTVGTLLDVD